MDTAEIHDLRLARRRTAIPIPDSACRVIAAFDLDDPVTSGGVKFRLQRLRRGVQIYFCVPVTNGLFMWNVSAMQGVYPASFAEARKWAKAYAARYGQTIEEMRKERMKIATGQDRKALKAGGCKEAWLSSDVPELYAEAMMRCQHAGGHCSYDGYCHYGRCDMEMMPEQPMVEEA